MPKLFSVSEKKILKQVYRSEKELNDFLTKNWEYFFPNLVFIKNEFHLEGNVRFNDASGRIDIFAFNPETKKFVIFELKKEFDKNVAQQASDYKDFVEDNFAQIYLETLQKHKKELPSYQEIIKDQVEIIFIAKKFSQVHITGAKKRNNVTLIKYFWFENDLFLIDYVNNDPDDEEKKNTEKIKRIAKIIEGKGDFSEIDIFFHKKEVSRRYFDDFYAFLSTLGEVQVRMHQTLIALRVEDFSFSLIPNGGKGKWKAFLQINTDINISSQSALIFDDRFDQKYLKEKNGKPKGSLGKERFEVFIQDEKQMQIFIDFLRGKMEITKIE